MRRRYLPRKVRRLVFERAKGACEYCKILHDYSSETFENEHILPIWLGGSDDPENLAFSCGGCNRCKQKRTHALDPADGSFVPLFNPRTQIWEEHFAWNEDATKIIGLTATGRATVEALRLNRVGLVNLRRLLKLEFLHPPA